MTALEKLPTLPCSLIPTSSPPLTIKGSIGGRLLNILIDSGSSSDFISDRVQQQLHLKLNKGGQRGQVSLADSTICKTGYPTFPVKLVLSDEITCTLPLITMPNLEYDVILGQNWLEKYNPQINFPKRQIRVYDHFLTAAQPASQALNLVSRRQMRRYKAENLISCLIQVTTKGLKPDTSVNTPNPNYNALVEEYQDIFEDLPPGLPPNRNFEHEIKVIPGTNPISKQPYKMSYADMDEVKREVQRLLDLKFIEPSVSPWGAPVLFVPKKDGTRRMVIDYRGLNQVTVKNSFPIPRISELMDRLGGAKVFTKLDLQSGYQQIRMKKEDVDKTAFKTRYGLFQYLVMPFGLTNAPATFQALMTKTFQPYLDDFVVVFIDDILVYSKNEDDHVDHCRKVFQKLRESKLFCKKKKCSFLEKEVEFLGHIIDAQGCRVDPKKIEAVKNWPDLQSQEEVQRFLGFCNFYRDYVESYSHKASPLTDLTGKKSVFKWTEKEKLAFEKLKQALVTTPVLLHPDPSKPFHISTDASDLAIGAVLQQDQGRGLQPVCYFSRKLNQAQRNYSTYEKEALAIVEAVKEWGNYLDPGHHTIVTTDHRALTYLQTQPQLNRRQARFVDKLSPYSLSIQYAPGKQNVADALSRISAILTISVSKPHSQHISKFREAYKLDPTLHKLSFQSKFQKVNSLWTEKRSGRIYVPDNLELKHLLLKEFHDSPTGGHFGAEKTYDSLARNYCWPGMRTLVKAYTSSCELCQRSKTPNLAPAGMLQPLPIPSYPWQEISMDIVGPLPLSTLGHTAILTVVDRLTKYAHFIPTNMSVSSAELADLIFREIFRYHGYPESIVSDRDPRFTSHYWKAFNLLVGTKLKMSTAYHPETDGQTERLHRTLEEALRSFVEKNHNLWDRFLIPLEFAYNNSKQASTKETPFFLNHGRHPHVPGDSVSLVSTNVPATEKWIERLVKTQETAKQALQDAQERQRKYRNMHRRQVDFQPGEMVYLSTKNLPLKQGAEVEKLLPRFIGPFKIMEKIGKNAYKLDLPETVRLYPVFNVRYLRIFIDPDIVFPGRKIDRPPPVITQYGEEFVVEKILAKRIRRGKTEYKVRWKGYSALDDSWEPEQTLKQDIPDIVKQYDASHE